MTERIYGDFEMIPDDLPPEARLELTVTAIDLTTQWQRCSAMSDLVAAYIAYAYHIRREMHTFHVYSSISTIFQELIENAAKYSRQREASIRVRVKHYNSVVRIEVQNDATIGTGERFEQYVKTLFASDLEELHAQIVEDRSRDGTQSGVGLVLLAKDYPVSLGFSFRRVGDEREVITVRAHYYVEVFL
jgi:hypothetical protein